MGVGASVAALVRALHYKSWFAFLNDTSFLIMEAGGRQGCKLGALTFNLIYSVALQVVRSELSAAGVVLFVRAGPQPFWVSVGAETTWRPEGANDFTPAVEATYVDDEALYFMTRSARDLLVCVPTVMRCLVSTFSYFGFRVNWSPGKTEALIAPTGRGAIDVRRFGGTIPLPSVPGSPSLRIEESYVHVG